ncbi:MAG: CvpA family protein [Saprospiraceae bacterium]
MNLVCKKSEASNLKKYATNRKAITFVFMIIDILFAITVIGGFYHGYQSGIIKTVFYALSLMLGFIIAVRFTPSLTLFLSDTLNVTSVFLFVLAFLICFGLTLLFIRMLGKTLEEILKSAHINFINKAAGGLLMAGLYVFFLSMLVWFVDKSDLISRQTKQESQTYEVLEDYPAAMRKAWEKTLPFMEKMWDEAIKVFNKMEK